MFVLILDLIEDFHTVEDRRLHRIFCGLYRDFLILSRLPDTSMTSIAMGFFAANMERKLRLLFAPEYGWALDYDFDLGELVIFPRFPDVPAIQ